MKEKKYKPIIPLTWDLLKGISQLESFDRSWKLVEKREGENLLQLKEVATVRSIGASTRIEGSKMGDEEVEIFLDNIKVTEIKDRDEEEVLGYFEVLNLIGEVYQDIPLSETGIKSLHNLLMKYSKKDAWHKGGYKQQDNAVQAILPNGDKQIIFRTTCVGLDTEEAMRKLIAWYEEEVEIHALVKCAIFVYEFLSIHPFQDGNGRLSRLLTTLLLLKEGYEWIQYISFEHEIESRKVEYYKELRRCQSQRPNEDLTTWVYFFLDALENVQNQLENKLMREGARIELSQKDNLVLTYIEDHAGCSSGELSEKLGIASRTVKRILKKLVEMRFIKKEGVGRGVNYMVL